MSSGAGPSVLGILEARRRIAGHVRRTPLVPSRFLSDAAGVPAFLKLESLQVTGSFKARGALNAALARPAGETRRGLVTASAGNHGQALAWAAALAGLDATVFTPRSAPRTKLEAIRRYGASLHAEAADYDEAERLAARFAAAQEAAFVSAYNDPAVIAGAGTIGIEILEDLPDVAALVVPLGGGGLLSGLALAARSASRTIEVVGVEAEASQAFAAALAAGRMVPITPRPTLADGLAGNADPGTITFDLIRSHVDRLVCADEAFLRNAIRMLMVHERLIAEGAGAAAVAAVLEGLAPRRGPLVAIISGANIDADTLREILIG